MAGILSTVQVKITRTADGRQVLKLKSTDTITEPFITLLVEVSWARGRSVREYTMLLDPPVYTPGQSPATNAPVAAPSAGTGAREGRLRAVLKYRRHRTRRPYHRIHPLSRAGPLRPHAAREAVQRRERLDSCSEAG